LTALLPAAAQEVFIPVRSEAELLRVEADYESLPERPHGELTVTSLRVAFVTERVATVQLGAETIPVRAVRVNVSYANFVSVAAKVERKLFIAKELIELSYEAEGIARKAIFRLRRRGYLQTVVDTIKTAAAKFRERVREPRLPLAEFMAFLEFMAVDKSIRPLYYDSVSRCVVLGSSYFCITSPEWSIEGSPDIVEKARAWIDEFKSLRGGRS
jgi:hypothetical protein